MSSLYLPYLLADYYRVLEIATVVVGILILLSSLDDLFIDGWYWLRQVYRKLLVKRRRYTPLTSEQLRAQPQQPLAIALGLLVYGAAMEVAQSFTVHRFGDPWDWLADAAGLFVLLPFALQRR